MSTSATPTLMTLDDFLALPDDGVKRDLIRGELREYPEATVTRRNRRHSRVEAKVVHLLHSWLKRQPSSRGEVHSGEVGCILNRNPQTTVGIDVAYFSAEILAAASERTSFIEGAPVLAVEVLSPYDKLENIDEKIDVYLENGVQLVWIIDPHFQTVRVHRPAAEPVMFNIEHELSAVPELPGFCVPVAAVFE